MAPNDEIRAIAFGRHCFSSLRLIRMLRSRFGARVDGTLMWLIIKKPLRLSYQDQEYRVMPEAHLNSISPTGRVSPSTTAFLQSVAEFLEYQKIPTWRAWLVATDEARFGKGIDKTTTARYPSAGYETEPDPDDMKAWLRGKGKDDARTRIKTMGPLGKVVFGLVVVAITAIFVCGFITDITPAVKWTASAFVCGSGDHVVIQFERNPGQIRTDRAGGVRRGNRTRTIVRCVTPQGQMTDNKYWQVAGVIYAMSCLTVLIGMVVLALGVTQAKSRE
jgi:hypothetical protein